MGDRENNRIQIFSQSGELLDVWTQFGRPSGLFITQDDRLYVADSESGPDTGAGELTGIMKGIRIGSAIDGTVHSFIEDLEPSETTIPEPKGLVSTAQVMFMARLSGDACWNGTF